MLHILYIFTSTADFVKNTSKAISQFIKRNHTNARRDWIQKYKPEGLSYNKTKTHEFVIHETQLKIVQEIIWLRVVAIKFKTKNILGISTSK
jgi:hypothetical protein